MFFFIKKLFKELLLFLQKLKFTVHLILKQIFKAFMVPGNSPKTHACTVDYLRTL
jgi:hypothetical protein